MKPSEKIKIQKTIARIESGDFNEIDVDHLLISLRSYSKNSAIFKELADFVAHPDLRDEGIARSSLEYFYLSMKFFIEYVAPSVTLDITKPFPHYIFKLMKYQIEKCTEAILKSKFHVSKSRLKARLDSIFREDKKDSMMHIRNNKLLRNNADAIYYILGFVAVYPVFDQDIIISEIEKVIHFNKLSFHSELFHAQTDRIVLCILLLLHDSKFMYGAHRLGHCEISCDTPYISYDQRKIESYENTADIDEEFGFLYLQGHIFIKQYGKDVTFCYPLVLTKLLAKNYCDESIFSIEPLNETQQNGPFKKTNFQQNLGFTSNRKIGAI